MKNLQGLNKHALWYLLLLYPTLVNDRLVGMVNNLEDCRIASHFSCGAASAVATKLTIADYGHARVVIFNAFVKEEHADNRRFLADCERWFDHPVTVLRDEKYGASVHEVWRRKRFINSGIFGALCSVELKHTLIEAACVPSDIHVLGYTADKKDAERFSRFTEKHPGLNPRAPLVERGLKHADCLAIIERAGIEIPLMYRLGYGNANCVGCCKGGEGYWNKVRMDFPDVFIQVQEIQESIGSNSYFFRNRATGARIGLKQLDPNAGRDVAEPEITCSFFCEMAEQDIEAALPQRESGTASTLSTSRACSNPEDLS